MNNQFKLAEDDLVKELAKTNARLNVIETFLVQEFELEGENCSNFVSTQISREKKEIFEYPKSYHLLAEDFPPTHNVHMLERDAGGGFRWTGEGTTTVIELSIGLLGKKTLQLGFVSIIKKEYIKKIVLRINGKIIKYRIRFINGHNYLVAPFEVETLESRNILQLEISIPETHSPAALGISDDTRKLGIAISDIHFIPTLSVVERLKRKFLKVFSS